MNNYAPPALRQILLINANPELNIVDTLQYRPDYQVTIVQDFQSAEVQIKAAPFDVCIVTMPSLCSDILATLSSFFCRHGSTENIAVFPDKKTLCAQTAFCLTGYFFDYFTMPVDNNFFLFSLGHAAGRASIRKQINQPSKKTAEIKPIIGCSPAIEDMLGTIKKLKTTEAPVLISGESGAGKELAARAVHSESTRCNGPFIAVNCGAISPNLMQAEFFGSQKGSYTGATSERKGYIEAANGGTLFLDEIADLPLEMQTSLLRYLQENTIFPVGSHSAVKVDTRVIAACNTDLSLAVKQGRFREDLFFRLNVIPLKVPPLRYRKEDILLLAHHFFNMYRHEQNHPLLGFSHAAIEAMLSYDWPGNVRELINRIRRGLIMANAKLITPADLEFSAIDFRDSVDDHLQSCRFSAEKNAVEQALKKTNNNVTKAAKALGISRMTLYRMIDKHHLRETIPPVRRLTLVQ